MSEKLGQEIADTVEDLVVAKRHEEDGRFHYDFSDDDKHKLRRYFFRLVGLVMGMSMRLGGNREGMFDLFDDRLTETAKNIADFHHEDFNDDFLAEMFFQGIAKSKLQENTPHP